MEEKIKDAIRVLNSSYATIDRLKNKAELPEMKEYIEELKDKILTSCSDLFLKYVDWSDYNIFKVISMNDVSSSRVSIISKDEFLQCIVDLDLELVGPCSELSTQAMFIDGKNFLAYIAKKD